MNPEAKDPGQPALRLGEGGVARQVPADRSTGPWRIYGRGRATTWTIKFDMDQAPKGRRLCAWHWPAPTATAGWRSRSTARRRHDPPVSTNALRYNTNKSVWQEHTLKFDAALLKQGENEIQLTVPAGELTTGVVYDYLRLELDENAKPEDTPAAEIRFVNFVCINATHGQLLVMPFRAKLCALMSAR